MAPTRAKTFIQCLLMIVLITGELVAGSWLYPDPASALASNPAKPSAAAAVPTPPTPPPAPQAEVLSKRLVEYHMDVALEDGGILQGTQTVTWKHPGTKTVTELYLHMYPNAFESANTTFMKESGGKLRNDRMPKDGYGSITLKELTTEDGLSLMHRTQYVQPDDGNVNDRTLLKVRLPKPVKGGESITLHMKYEVKLPQIFARMGVAGDFVMAGQWFPKLSVYEPKGRRGRAVEGWNLHQYHGNSEFYADFGIYSVRIRVPDRYIVAATGFPTSTPVTQNGQKIYQFYADDVHDFAWAASPHFVTAEEPFSSAGVPGVKIKLYLDPAHKDLKDRYFYAAKSALENYSKSFGTYPYSTLSIVVPPKMGNGAGGMEYPTLITAFGADDSQPGYELERTVVHEIGHQYFYGMIASNEFEEPWLDEGFTSYAEDRLMEQEYGLIPNLPLQASQISSPEPLTREAWKYSSSTNYAQNSYLRGKLILYSIEQQVGKNKMNTIMRTYARKFRFKHPTSQDFQSVVEQVTHKSWSDFFEQYVYGSQMADFAVDQIRTKRLGAGRYESTVTISKRGGDVPAVPIQITFENGQQLMKSWNGADSSVTYKLEGSSPVALVTIDPLHTIVLEHKHINNMLRARLDEQVSIRWNLGITKLIELWLGSLSW
ncbi:M1 family metallopeptidase [Paenibacillus massiliensis]|uniref:M1 family metallopeptidase n=2 Tax=Paenibacillus TaxID=44249 RepID=UPI000367F98C